MGHIRDQTLPVIEQLEETVGAVEILARVNAELAWVTLGKVDKSNNCLAGDRRP